MNLYIPDPWLRQENRCPCSSSKASLMESDASIPCGMTGSLWVMKSHTKPVCPFIIVFCKVYVDKYQFKLWVLFTPTILADFVSNLSVDKTMTLFNQRHYFSLFKEIFMWNSCSLQVALLYLCNQPIHSDTNTDFTYWWEIIHPNALVSTICFSHLRTKRDSCKSH